MRPNTLVSQAWGSTSFSLAVSIRVYREAHTEALVAAEPKDIRPVCFHPVRMAKRFADGVVSSVVEQCIRNE